MECKISHLVTLSRSAVAKENDAYSTTSHSIYAFLESVWKESQMDSKSEKK